MANRWLPAHVYEWRDRHGKTRYRFKRRGFPSYSFRAAPGTPEFMAELAAVRAMEPALPGPATPVIAGSIDDLCRRYYASPRWLGLEESTKRVRRGIIDRFRERRNRHGRRYGERPVALATAASLDRLLGSMAATPQAANNLRKVLKLLFGYAVKLGWRRDNPALATDGFKRGEGHHTWTEGDIEAYRERHPYGTRARLAMELLLNTAARRCNVAALERAAYRGGRFHIRHAKGGEETIVPAMAETVAAIEAMPTTGIGHFLVTTAGKPFTVNGFGNWFRDRCDEARLPHCSAHGLRKAMARRLAESHATDAQGRSVTGQKKNETFAYYAEKADREALAQDAVANLATRLVGKPRKNNGGADG
jgi:integrase